ncbi:MAG TPA: hypothetical protein VFQ53_15445 [Kofleriaceae bacterium]|nr:hypothetical protein [Kofleriaceae bacterium]
MHAVVVAVALVGALATPARAEPADLVARPLVLARHEVEANLTLEVNLRARSIGVPLSLAPDLWVGVTPRLTLGLIHGNRSLDQIDVGGSLCLRGNDQVCDATYQGSGIDARYAWRDDVAPRVRLVLRDLDPAKPALTAGALARWQRGRFAITSDPYLRLGLANRDEGNRDALVVPLWLAVQPVERWLVALHTGWNSELAVIRDGWHVPLGVATTVRPWRRLEVSAELGFVSLLGPQNQFQDRALLVTIGWTQAVSSWP